MREGETQNGVNDSDVLERVLTDVDAYVQKDVACVIADASRGRVEDVDDPCAYVQKDVACVACVDDVEPGRSSVRSSGPSLTCQALA